MLNKFNKEVIGNGTKREKPAVSGIVFEDVGQAGVRNVRKLGVYFPVHLNRGEPPLTAGAIAEMNQKLGVTVTLGQEISDISHQPQYVLQASSSDDNKLFEIGASVGLSREMITYFR